MRWYAKASNEIVAEYTYDAWGNILSVTNSSGTDISGNATHIANLNPLRYRGYVYDTETGFYYLQSRYYDPAVGRFVNGDGAISGINGPIIGYNQFAYSFNNPVNMDDENGNWPKWSDVKSFAKKTSNAVKKAAREYVKGSVEMTKKILKAAGKSVSLKASFGEGIGISKRTSLAIVKAEVTIVSKHDMLSVELRNGKIPTGQEVSNQISGTLSAIDDSFNISKTIGNSKYHSNNYDSCSCDYEHTLASANP